MARCPDGHDSVSTDYCDVCGMLIGDAGPATLVPPDPSVALPPLAGAACPQCGVPRSPGQFCEACGYNFATGALPPPVAPTTVTPSPAAPPPPAPPAPQPAPPAPATSGALKTWTAVVAADRAYYEVIRAASGADGEDIPFPAYCPERRFQLTGTEMRIGRRSPSRGLEPEMDLTGPPTDPGISRLHAVLIATPDGGWAILDPGSANGTQVNGTDIPTSQQVPLEDGDRISLGAWTTITIHGG